MNLAELEPLCPRRGYSRSREVLQNTGGRKQRRNLGQNDSPHASESRRLSRKPLSSTADATGSGFNSVLRLLVTLFLFALLTGGARQGQGLTPGPDEFKSYAETIPGSGVTFEMLPVPGGTFLMGSPADEPGRSSDEGPQHLVTVRAFWMGKTEVTWDEYDQFAFGRKDASISNASPAHKGADALTQPTPPYADESFGYGKGQRPVISITHHAAMEYCRWLSARTGKLYRLPTEAEWEYASRAGSKDSFSFGADSKQLGDYAWYRDNSNDEPHPVALKKPSALGLYDMHGNVAEWCVDQYDGTFYNSGKPGVAVIGPVLLPAENRYPHVVRGGSWDDDANRLRCAARRGSVAAWSRRDPQSPQSIWWHTEATFVGFRVLRPVVEQENLKGLRSRVTRSSP